MVFMGASPPFDTPLRGGAERRMKETSKLNIGWGEKGYSRSFSLL